MLGGFLKQVFLLYPCAGEEGFSVPSLSSAGAESRHTAGVTVAVLHDNTRDTAHRYSGLLIYTHTLNQLVTC